MRALLVDIRETGRLFIFPVHKYPHLIPERPLPYTPSHQHGL